MVAGVILLGRMLQTQTNEAFLYLGGACLLILVGVYELHRQIPLLLHRFAKQNLRHKYKEENLFFLGQIGRRIHSAGRTMAVVAILLTISLATMFVGLTMGAGYKANMKAYYPYDAGVAIDAPLEKSSMDSIVSFTEEHCEVEDSVIYYLYAVPENRLKPCPCPTITICVKSWGFLLLSWAKTNFWFIVIHGTIWTESGRA